MAGDEKILIIKPTEIDSVRALLARAVERGDHTGGALTISEACAGATAWAVETLTGSVVMAYAMRPVGKTCWIVAASGDLPGVDLTKAVLPTIEKQAVALGCQQVAVTTRRSGLVHKLKRAGWREAATTLRKVIQ